LAAAIVFYVSGHGFGHASRSIEVINAILVRRPETRIGVRTAAPRWLFDLTVKGKVTFSTLETDTGVVQIDALTLDEADSIRRASAFHSDLVTRAASETRVLRELGAGIIVGDIPPLAFDVAAALGVPSVAIGNFTWHWIYETHPGFAERASGVLDTIRQSYGRATLALQLPFGAGFDVFPRVRRVPLVARRPTQTKADTRAHFGLPASGHVALLSFGGYGMPSLDLSATDCLDEWTIVTTDRTSTAAAGAGAVVLPERVFEGAFRYEDLVSAVDVVVTKPGYGIIAECISTRTAMLYTSRGAFREYELLVAEMPRYLRCAFISQEALFAGRWRGALAALLAQPEPPETLDLGGAEAVAEILRQVV
jgi:L-arabinokinase